MKTKENQEQPEGSEGGRRAVTRGVSMMPDVWDAIDARVAELKKTAKVASLSNYFHKLVVFDQHLDLFDEGSGKPRTPNQLDEQTLAAIVKALLKRRPLR